MDKTLTEVCTYLNNWFDRGQKKIFGDISDIVIENGRITNESFINAIKEDQYYRIIGSVFNDGVYKYNLLDTLKDETFNGAVWLMAIPQNIIDVAGQIEEWQKKYESVDSENLSPYQSESFKGYSYSKATGASNNGANNNTWQGVFGNKLSDYKKMKL